MAISRMQRFLIASVGVYGARGYRTIVGAGAVSSLLSQRVKGTGRLGMPCAHSASGVRCCISPAFANAMAHAVRWQSSSRATDYYTLLGVKPDASADEIKASYKKLVFQYHPDRNKDPGAEEMFKSISEAYRVIGNKERRREYDMRRGSASSFSNTTSGGGFPSDHSQGTPWGYQQMSKEDADRLFRDLFGGMRVDQIFRDFEEEMRRSNVRSGQGRAQSEFSEDERAFRPFFRSGSTRVFTDSHGNRMEEREFTDARGATFRVRTVTSEQANGSTNQKAEDFYNTKAGASRDGRFRYGNSSFKVNPRDFTNDFGQAALGMRTHGRHPLVAMLMLAAWGTIIGTFVFVGFSFFLSHPLFTTAVLLLLFLRRFRIF